MGFYEGEKGWGVIVKMGVEGCFARISLNPSLFGQIPKSQSKKFPVFFGIILGLFFLTFLWKIFFSPDMSTSLSPITPFGQNGGDLGSRAFPPVKAVAARAFSL